MARIQTLPVRIGDALVIGAGHPIVVQTMCNTHTSDVDATVAQALELAAAGAQLVRITVPGRQDVPHVAEIKRRLRAAGCNVPLVADIHFSSETAIDVAPVVEKVRINPGNFHPDHEQARAQFARFLQVCKEHGTAVRVGLNHGSLGRYITDRYGNTPHAMAMAAMEWLEMCIEAVPRNACSLIARTLSLESVDVLSPVLFKPKALWFASIWACQLSHISCSVNTLPIK